MAQPLSDSSAGRPFVMPLLSVMMFVQFFVWGSWFPTAGQALGANELAAAVKWAYDSAPLGAIFAPLFLGLIADRFFPSQIVMGVLFLVGGVLMWMAHGAATAGETGKLPYYFVGHMLCYMPTLGLGNTIAFSNIDRLRFPAVRVWGTIGWIAAGLLVGFLGWSSELKIFLMTALASLFLGVLSFFLPHTPPPAKGQKIDLRALLMIDAWKLLGRPGFLVFIICSGLICIPLAYYYGVTAQFLTNSGFNQAASFMTLGQMSEIFFMLLIPFFFRRLGVKWMIFVGMLAWILRYLLFAFGAPDQVYAMLLIGVVLHGICYDFFFVTGFMYTDAVSPRETRGQAQSLLVFVTQGLGMFIGFGVVYGKTLFGYEIFGGHFPRITSYNDLDAAIEEGRPEDGLSFAEQFGKMFSQSIPETVDPALLSRAMLQWKDFWIVPAIMAAVIALLFLVAFWDKVKIDTETEDAGASRE